MRTLLLNATYEPLCVVSERRAVVLVLKEKAEIVSRGKTQLHAEKLTFQVPTVIRLVRYMAVPFRNKVPLNRRAIFLRDNFACQYCNRPAENLDHVVPRSRGGTHTWENVVAACRSCNNRKRDRYLHETSLRLKRPPRLPHAQTWVIALTGSIDPAWQPYLPMSEAIPA